MRKTDHAPHMCRDHSIRGSYDLGGKSGFVDQGVQTGECNVWLDMSQSCRGFELCIFYRDRVENTGN